MGKVLDYIQDHLALVITVAAAILVIIFLVIFFCWRRRRYRGYQQIEMGLEEFLEEQKINELKNSETDRAEIQARFFLRGLPHYTLIRPVPYIGSRKGKYHYIVKNTTEQRKTMKDQLLIMSSRGENCVFPFTDATKPVITGLLERVQHPFVWPTLLSDFDAKNQLFFVFQPYRSQGSLKDSIYKTEPDYPYNQKYQLSGKPLTERAISVFGRQILEGLRYFEQMDFPYGQLKSSNVIVDGGNCRLAGYENTIFGLPPPLADTLLAPLLTEHRKYNKNRKLLNVLQFGHLIFEMATGIEMDTATLSFIPKCSKKVADVLDFIFGKQSIPGRDPDYNCPFPTVKELMEHPFFTENITSIKQSDLTFESPSFDPGMVEILESIKNQKKLSESKSKGSKSKPQKSVKRRTSTTTSLIVSTTTTPSTSTSTAPITSTPSTATPSTATSQRTQSISSAPPSRPQSTYSTAPSAPPAPSAPVPPPTPIAAPPPPASGERGALLSSITGFNSGKLKKVKTVDKSKPVFK